MKANIFTAVSAGVRGKRGTGASCRGVTLLEMLVSMLVFTVVILVAAGLFRDSLNRLGSRAAGKKIYSESARVLDYMQKYLPSAMCRDGGGIRIDFKGRDTFVRFVSPFSAGRESDLAKFGIYFDRDAEAVKVSVVRIDSDRPDFEFPAGFSGAQTLGESITSFNLFYFDGSDWLRGWDTSGMSEPSLPVLVRVELTAAAGRKTEGVRSEKSFTCLIRVN